MFLVFFLARQVPEIIFFESSRHFEIKRKVAFGFSLIEIRLSDTSDEWTPD
jgi:hypothetical protein